jgi:adenosylhomocysteine nucleosidase
VTRAATILAVTGLETEAKIARSLKTRTVCSGGNTERLEAAIRAAFGPDIVGIISFGVAGALSRNERSGTIILANAVVSADQRYPVDPTWLAILAAKLPKAVHGTILGVDSLVAEARQKARLGVETGALVVDMESHVAARLAAVRRCPFTALRVILDPMEMTLPPAALMGLQDDGQVSIDAVLRSLMQVPSQLPPLMRTAWAARRAFTVLRQSRTQLSADFCCPN